MIDPIDGNRAFISGNSAMGHADRLQRRYPPSVGVLDQPYWGALDRWSGQAVFDAKGGRRRFGRGLRARLEDAVISSTHPWAYFTESEQALFRTIDGHAPHVALRR